MSDIENVPILLILLKLRRVIWTLNLGNQRRCYCPAKDGLPVGDEEKPAVLDVADVTLSIAEVDQQSVGCYRAIKGDSGRADTGDNRRVLNTQTWRNPSTERI